MSDHQAQNEAANASTGLKNTAFGQQKISAWQPVIAPKWTVACLAFFGILGIALGVLLIFTSNSAVECTVSQILQASTIAVTVLLFGS